MAYAKRLLPIGQVFNKLTILEEVPSEEKSRRYVYCLCECGSKKVLRYDGVKSGRIKSCGCLLSSKNAQQIAKMVITRRINKEKVIKEQYIGRKFFRLTITDIHYHPRYKGTWFWVQCDCGKELAVSLMRLKLSHTKSCGCIRRQNCMQFVSQIDGEQITIECQKYYRTLKPDRQLLHVYEAKKAFALAGRTWPAQAVVHHIDLDTKNNNLDNLVVFENNSEHHLHHGKMDRAMYDFITKNGLIKDFHQEYPDLRMTTLADIIRAKQSKES